MFCSSSALYLCGKQNVPLALQITSKGWCVGFQCMLVPLLETGEGAVVIINSELGNPQHKYLAGEIMREISMEYNWSTKVEFFHRGLVGSL